ncbi:YdhK family protein [Corynebacterium callunae]|uniref:YdhK family protein n=1 Tax=Corynebacterium callunae TaxID=1721 RepID=UPI003981F231
MKNHAKLLLISLLAVGTVTLSACSPADTSSTATPESTATSSSAVAGHGDHSSMAHSMSGSEVPAAMVDATDPTYPVGTEVTLTADHMPGMNGATATVAGAYTTYTYSVDYVPTGGGDTVKDHRWVVQEEIKDAGTERLANGTKVTLTADHMAGMNGAEATIVASTDETVYAVDYEMNGMTMENHMWVVESEMQSLS